MCGLTQRRMTHIQGFWRSCFSKGFLILKCLLISPLLAADPSLAGIDRPHDSGVERVFGMVQAFSDADLPPLSVIQEQCQQDTLCTARILAEIIGPAARLEAVRHPSTDTIRWVESTASITKYWLSDAGVLTITLAHFGRQAIDEIKAIMLPEPHTVSPPLRGLVIDLRNNSGGNFKRMLQVASLFTGHIQGAVNLVKTHRVTSLDIPANTPQRPYIPLNIPLDILVGPQTASSAEVLAALLKQHAGAHLIGGQTYGKNYLSRVIPIHHDLRLVIPDARITIPGIRLVGGLIPDVLLEKGD